jgi:hypothetical protein
MQRVEWSILLEIVLCHVFAIPRGETCAVHPTRTHQVNGQNSWRQELLKQKSRRRKERRGYVGGSFRTAGGQTSWRCRFDQRVELCGESACRVCQLL